MATMAEYRAKNRGPQLLQALKDLLEDTQHKEHNCGGTPDQCPVLAARQLISEIEGTPR